MSWFEEQIEERIQQDNEMLADACDELYEAVTGRRPPNPNRVYDEFKLQQSAIDELLYYYHFKKVEIPKELTRVTQQLDYVLHPLGMMWREVELVGEWYKDAVGAMIARRSDNGQTVTLVPGKMGGYSFLDVETGKRIRINKKNAALLDPMAFAVYLSFPQRKLTITDLLQFIMKNLTTQTVVYFFLATIAATLMGLLLPKLTYLLYSDVIEAQSVTLLASIFIFMICIGISSAILESVKALLNARLSTQLSTTVQAATMERLFSMPVSFFREYSSGELASRMESINMLCSTIIAEVFSVSITSLFSIMYITQIFRYARSLVAPALLITVVMIIFTILETMVEANYEKKLMELSAKNAGLVYGVINGIQKIKLAGAEKRAFARWTKNYAEEARVRFSPPFLLLHKEDVNLMISLVGQFILYYIAVQTQVSVAEYGAFMSAYSEVSAAFLLLAGVTSTMATVRPILDVAKSIMDTEPETSEQKRTVMTLGGRIELNNVTFRYAEDMPKIVDNMTLKIPRGDYVAIVGKTGCGKSTLIRLLLGFEKPQRGAVYFDGQDIEKMDQQSLRRNIGTVMQDGSLFEGDIFSNITISCPEATMEEAWEAAEIAGVAEDIRRMPMGMSTVIPEDGGGISGGQKQRILIARAIAPKPKILIMDEATSALDNITQKQVSDALDNLNCTRIVIAHRLSTIQHCNRILYLENGKVAEEGTYDDLMALDGKFAEMVKRQQVNGN